MQGDGRADAGEQMNLAGVAELFFGGGCGRGLEKFAKPGASIGKSPGGKLDAELLQCLGHSGSLTYVHGTASL